MSEYPDGWFRGTAGPGGAPGGASAGEPTTQIPGGSAAGGRSSGSAWPDQPPSRSGSSSGSGRGSRTYSPRPYSDGPSGRSSRSGGGGSYGTGGGRRWLRPRRILGILCIVVVLILVAGIAEYFNLNGKLTRANVLTAYAGQPAQGDGTNWLIAGSDSRQGLGSKELKKLSAGQGITGHRSDTVMVLHVPSSGNPILISIPRDSWVNIPGYGFNKINAAYDFGGPKLLAKTVQNATGLRIDHYMEIGFGGFVNVVNAVGGVRMCLKHNIFDQASGLHLHKGCHNLNGDQALAFVRDRHTFLTQDLQRIQDQRLFLKALLTKVTSTGVILNPFASIPAASGAASTLTVDEGTSLYQLAEVAFSLSHPVTTTVPIANSNFVTPSGADAVEWNTAEAHEMFRDLNLGKRVPKRLITGSHIGARN